MLQLEWQNGVHDPVKTQDRIDTYGHVVPPNFLVCKLLPQEAVFRMWVAETPVVVDVPEARIYAVDGREQDEDCLGRYLFVHAVNAQGCIEKYSGHVLPAVEEMGKLVPCIPVTSETLQQTPYAGQRTKKPGDA